MAKSLGTYRIFQSRKLLRVWGLCELSECSKVRANFSLHPPHARVGPRLTPAGSGPLLSREDVLHGDGDDGDGDSDDDAKICWFLAYKIHKSCCL